MIKTAKQKVLEVFHDAEVAKIDYSLCFIRSNSTILSEVFTEEEDAWQYALRKINTRPPIEVPVKDCKDCPFSDWDRYGIALRCVRQNLRDESSIETVFANCPLKYNTVTIKLDIL